MRSYNHPVRQILLAIVLAACGSNVEVATDASPPPDAPSPADANPLIAARPYMSKAPAGYDPAVAWPLVVELHGYTYTGATIDAYFKLAAYADDGGYLIAYPDGLVDSFGFHFWNATDACCNVDHDPVDDVAYLGAVIDDMSARYHVDPRRIFLVGHSNGAFMSHRLACDLAPRIAAIVSVAGATWMDASKCAPSEPVSILDIHGDSDAVINYNGGLNPTGAYPSEAVTTQTWAQKNGCTGGMNTSAAPIDLDTGLAGAETGVMSYDGCPASGAVELWTIHGGSHFPAFPPSFAQTAYAFLMAHPKPQ